MNCEQDVWSTKILRDFELGIDITQPSVSQVEKRHFSPRTWNVEPWIFVSTNGEVAEEKDIEIDVGLCPQIAQQRRLVLDRMRDQVSKPASSIHKWVPITYSGSARILHRSRWQRVQIVGLHRLRKRKPV